MRGRISRVLAVQPALAMFLLVACGGEVKVSLEKRLRTDRVESIIQSSVQGKGVTADSVACPENVPLQAGNTFECTVTYNGGKTTKVRVRQTDGKGRVVWEPTTMIADLVSQEIDTTLREIGVSVASVECPEGVPLEEGKTFGCTVTYGEGKTTVVEVTQLDDSGRFDWRPTVLFAENVNRQLESSISAETGEEVSVECPEGVRLEEGAIFECDVSLPDGSTVAAVVTQRDDQGNVAWELET